MKYYSQRFWYVNKLCLFCNIILVMIISIINTTLLYYAYLEINSNKNVNYTFSTFQSHVILTTCILEYFYFITSVVPI